MPTPEELSQLELPAGEAVMILERRIYTAADELIEVAFGVPVRLDLLVQDPRLRSSA
jgi:hypothetical protein